MSGPARNTLEVGTNGRGEVVINHPNLDVDAEGVGHIVFSVKQARNLAWILNAKACEAAAESVYAEEPCNNDDDVCPHGVGFDEDCGECEEDD